MKGCEYNVTTVTCVPLIDLLNYSIKFSSSIFSFNYKENGKCKHFFGEHQAQVTVPFAPMAHVGCMFHTSGVAATQKVQGIGWIIECSRGWPFLTNGHVGASTRGWCSQPAAKAGRPRFLCRWGFNIIVVSNGEIQIFVLFVNWLVGPHTHTLGVVAVGRVGLCFCIYWSGLYRCSFHCFLQIWGRWSDLYIVGEKQIVLTDNLVSLEGEITEWLLELNLWTIIQLIVTCLQLVFIMIGEEVVESTHARTITMMWAVRGSTTTLILLMQAFLT